MRYGWHVLCVKLFWRHGDVATEPLTTTWPHERPRVCGRPGVLGAFLSRTLPGSPRLGTCRKITHPSPHQHVVEVTTVFYRYKFVGNKVTPSTCISFSLASATVYRAQTLERLKCYKNQTTGKWQDFVQ